MRDNQTLMNTRDKMKKLPTLPFPRQGRQKKKKIIYIYIYILRVTTQFVIDINMFRPTRIHSNYIVENQYIQFLILIFSWENWCVLNK